MEDFTNKIIHGNCVEVMEKFDDNVIDLTITSPPYDNLRNYKGKSLISPLAG
jgi:site-specific DNA-methyltransferase (adenine-specific)